MSSDPVVALDKLFELAARLGELMQHELADRGLTAARGEVLLVLSEGGDAASAQPGAALHTSPCHGAG